MPFKHISGIYTITNLLDNKIYVGYAVSMLNRMATHESLLMSNAHNNIHLQRAVKKYGIENFLFEVLEECPEEYLCALEHYWCNILNTHNPEYGYNIKPTHPYDINHRNSEETREKISKAKKGIRTKPESIKKVYQHSKDGKLIEIWDNVKSIIKKNPDFGESAIYRNAKGIKKSYKNFIWKYHKIKNYEEIGV